MAISLVPMREKTRVISGNSCQQSVLDFDVGAQGFLHAHADGLVEHGSDGAFVELRHELRAEAIEQPDRTGKQRDRGNDHDQPAQSKRHVKHRLVERASRDANNAIIAFVNFAAQQERAQHRHEREREHERAAEREHHGERHRMKHFPFDAGERENRDINNRDDDHAEEHRRLPTCLLAASTVCDAFLGRERAAKLVLPLPSWRTMFSTMTTAPSMIRPKSIAPRLIRFPEMPKRAMPVSAKRNESGMAEATMSAARQLPSRRQQHGHHEHRAFEQIRS